MTFIAAFVGWIFKNPKIVLSAITAAAIGYFVWDYFNTKDVVDAQSDTIKELTEYNEILGDTQEKIVERYDDVVTASKKISDAVISSTQIAPRRSSRLREQIKGFEDDDVALERAINSDFQERLWCIESASASLKPEAYTEKCK